MRPAQHSRNPPVFCGSIVSTTCFKTVPQELQLTCAENVERANRDGNMRVSAENRCYQANGRCKGELLPEGDLLVLFCGEVDEQILMVQGAPYTQSSACSPLCSRDTGSGDGCDGKCSHVAREARCPALCLLLECGCSWLTWHRPHSNCKKICEKRYRQAAKETPTLETQATISENKILKNEVPKLRTTGVLISVSGGFCNKMWSR